MTDQRLLDMHVRIGEARVRGAVCADGSTLAGDRPSLIRHRRVVVHDELRALR